MARLFELGLKRNELFVATKLSNGSHGYENTMKEFEMSMNNLDIDYVDLYLIHWPRPIAVRDTRKEHNEGTGRHLRSYIMRES